MIDRRSIRTGLRQSTLRRQRTLECQNLEPRHLLAGDLIAQWRADSLDATLSDGDTVSSWVDSEGSREAVAIGEPKLVTGQFGGRSVVSFDPSDGADGLLLRGQLSPTNGLNDFTVMVSFATSSQDLMGGQDSWFNNTGIVDASALGFSREWGISMNAAGRISVGIGGGLGTTPTTLYSSVSGLNDGQQHTVAFVRDESTISLYIDEGSADSQTGVPHGTIAPNSFGIGQLGTGTNHFSGQIAEVRIINGALDRAEVTAAIGELNSFYRNQIPAAVEDRFSLEEDSVLFFVEANAGVLSNDIDADGDELTAELVSPPAHGTVTLRDDGSLLYVPDNDFFGVDTFTYSAVDFRPSAPATVTMTVTPVYDPIVPVDDQYQSLPTKNLIVDAASGVLANDENPDMANLFVELVRDVSDGALTLNMDGSFEYDPQGFAGSTTFTYRVNDGTQLSDDVAVTLVLNTSPQVNDDTYQVLEDVEAQIGAAAGVLNNDFDPDGDVLRATLVEGPQNGTLDLNADGSFVYQPNLNYFGPDQFSYAITDGVDTIGNGVARIDVESVNDVPAVQPDSYLTLPDQPISVSAEFGLLANDSDVDSSELEASLVSGPDNGTLQLGGDGAFTYAPNLDFSGTDTFQYEVSDTLDTSEPVTVTLRVEPEPVIISEVLTASVASLETRVRSSTDEDFARGTEEIFDWIEVQNPFDVPLSIGGFYLTDDPDELTKWQIPIGTTLAPKTQMIFFASGKDVTDPALDELGIMHTNFKLSSDGEYTAIVGPSQNVFFELEYPNLRTDISYGLNQTGERRYFGTPTPGEANQGPEFSGVVGDTKFSVDRGFYSTTQSVEITTEAPTGEIYFTTNGSQPTPGNPDAQKYVQPVQVATTTVLRAAAFAENLLPSNVDTQSYVFIDHVRNQGNTPDGYPTQWKNRAGNGTLPADYEVDPEITQNPAYVDLIDNALQQVPTISIVTEVDNLFDRDTGIYQNPLQSGVEWERPASIELIHPNGEVGFQVDAGLRIQGGASREPEKSPKHSFRLLFKDIYGASKLNYPLFGPDATDEFDTIILRAGFNQSYVHHNTFQGDNRGRAQYVRDQWAKDAQKAMGWNAPANTYAHLYINGMYWGLYNPTERPTDGFGASYFGGEKDEYDVYNSGELLDGSNESWNTLFDITLDRSLTADEKYDALLPMLDMDAYIDYMLLNHYGGNADWDDHNWYSMRRRTEDGKWYFFMWDSEFIFVNENENTVRVSDGPRYPARIMRELSDSVEFKVRLADRIQLHMFNDGLLTPQKVTDRWNSWSDQITDAIIAESARWGDYRRDADPNSYPGGVPFELLERDKQWVRERARLLNDYFPDRTQTVIDQYRAVEMFPTIDAPVFSQRGGTVARETEITLQAADDAQIYYTLNGSDPRMEGGAIHAEAIEYAGPLTLKQDTTIKARALSTEGEWSAVDVVSYLLETVAASADSLRIVEIYYHPQAPSQVETDAGFDDDDDFEYLKLQNVSSDRIDLSNVRLRRQAVGDELFGVDFDFREGNVLQLAPGESVFVAEDVDGFAMRYAPGLSLAGQWRGGLSNAGEILILTAGEETIHEFSYDDAWFPSTDGPGYTLQHVDPSSADLNVWGQKDGWQVSATIGGSAAVSGPLLGDANGDGVFNPSDLVAVFQAGEYEDNIAGNSTFAEGDWNGDGDFTTADLVAAFQAGTYVAAANVAVGKTELAAAAIDLIFDRENEKKRLHLAPKQDSKSWSDLLELDEFKLM